MSSWSSFKEEQDHFNSWRAFLNEGALPDKELDPDVYRSAGIDSAEMEDSLLNWLEPLVGDEISADQRRDILALLKSYAQEEDILLEAIGGPTGPNKKFSSAATRDMNDLIATFELATAARKKLEKTINGWANANQIQFTAPGASRTRPAPSPEAPSGPPEGIRPFDDFYVDYSLDPGSDPTADAEEPRTREDIMARAVEAELVGLDDAESEEEMQRFLGFFKAEKGTLDKIDLLLTVGSIIPGYGCVVGATNSAFNAARAEWAWAVFDLIFAVPPICGSGLGETASAGKGVFKVLAKPAIKAGAKASRATRNALKVVEKMLGKVLPQAGVETLQKMAMKYAKVLQQAVRAEKTEKQVEAILTLMPLDMLNKILIVIDHSAKDIAPETVPVIVDLGEKFGFNAEEAAQAPIVDLMISLMEKVKVIDEAQKAKMLETLANVREQVEGFAADQPARVKEFIESLDAEDRARSAEEFIARQQAKGASARAREIAATPAGETATGEPEELVAERVQRLHEEKFSKLTKAFTH